MPLKLVSLYRAQRKGLRSWSIAYLSSVYVSLGFVMRQAYPKSAARVDLISAGDAT